MAVDIKTLRIGSHVLMNGVRAKVMRLNSVKLSEEETFHILVRGVSPDTGREGECGCFADDKAVQPIHITPELLKELGFVQKRMDYPYGKPDIWYVDPESAKLMENELVVPIVSIWPMEKFGFADWWKIRVLVGDRPMYEGEYVCRYLHEAEAFLALHGVELIKE